MNVRRRLLLQLLGAAVIMFIISLRRMKKTTRQRHKRIGLPRSYNLLDKIPQQVAYMGVLVGGNDLDCYNNLRLSKSAFQKLCYILENVGGLRESKYGLVQEKAAIFLRILAHHTKNRVAKFDHKRSGSTISKFFHEALNAVIRLHSRLYVHPSPVSLTCTNERWKSFQGCLGALDGTYISVNVPEDVQARYRTRKGMISTNVLGVCDTEGKFVYVLPGWEGPAADSRVLREAPQKTKWVKSTTRYVLSVRQWL